MSRTVWKYPVPMQRESHVLALPNGHRVLHVDSQYGTQCLWIEVDESETLKVSRRFIWTGTGWNIPEGYTNHIGTVLVDGGAFVWHLWSDE